VWDKALTFKIQGDFGSNGGDTGSFNLQDAWAQYAWDNGFSVKWGQFKLPVFKEVNVEDEYQLAMDRSVTSYAFSQGYSQGIQAAYSADAFRIAGGFSDGLNTANTDFNSAAEADWALNVRGDWKVMGADWERFNQFTSWRSAPDNALDIGAAIEYQSGGNTGFTANSKSYAYTVDGSFEGQGWNLFGAGYGNHVEPSGGTKLDNFGAVIQGGIFVADQFEIFARADAIFFDKDAGIHPVNEYFAAGGINYYVSPESQAAKFTAQFGYAFNDTSPLFGSGGILEGNTRDGFLGDSHKGEWAIGVQFQVMY